CVGTPSLPSGQADLSQVHDVVKQIYVKTKKDAIIVMKSTVSPGTGLRLINEIWKNHKNGAKIDYVSNPEFLREGQAINDWQKPDRIVIGADNEGAAETVKSLYKNVQAPILETDITSAEIIKYASNAFLTMKVSYINEIANLCEVVGANIDDVSHGIGLDNRIGKSFLKAGIGWGGSCFPKDTRGLDFLSAQYGYDFHLLKASIRVNTNQRLRVMHKLLDGLKSLPDKKIAILGLAFKPETDDVRESISLDLISILLKEGAAVRAFDPIAVENAKKVLLTDTRLIYADTAYEAVKNCEAIVLATEWPALIDLDWQKVRDSMLAPFIIIDGRNCLNPQTMKGIGFHYEAIGRKI
ncbi:MAG: UDP-glucose/GDP-mannose dehydrogenase family protein, partial [Candidatus Margulisbacteria bacterium]|nr:UDP-glucose/GDP-mannose dehydrogenase family protein [Candidatus Margulisiibacteriota bacterium]